MREIVFRLGKISKRKNGGCVRAVAYAAGLSLAHTEKNQIFDFSNRHDVQTHGMAWPFARAQPDESLSDFWNRVSTHHPRWDAVEGYSLVLALPQELTDKARIRLVSKFADLIAAVHRVAVHWAIHEPRVFTEEELNRNPDQFFVEDAATEKLHNGNWHAHLCISACNVDGAGRLGFKEEALDPVCASVLKIYTFARVFRILWTRMLNHTRDVENSPAPRLSHRSLRARGIPRVPQPHLGPRLSHARRKHGFGVGIAQTPSIWQRYEEQKSRLQLLLLLRDITRRRVQLAAAHRLKESETHLQNALESQRRMLGLLDEHQKATSSAADDMSRMSSEAQRAQSSHDRLTSLLTDAFDGVGHKAGQIPTGTAETRTPASGDKRLRAGRSKPS